MRNVVFSKISQNAIRQISLQTVRHLHSLDHQFHLSQKTGSLSRSIERGSKGINFLLSSALFHVVPTVLEISMVCALLSANFGYEYALMTTGTMAAYTGFTLGVTQWRTQFRRSMNAAENNASGKLTDSLINHESVKVFSTSEPGMYLNV